MPSTPGGRIVKCDLKSKRVKNGNGKDKRENKEKAKRKKENKSNRRDIEVERSRE